MRLQPLQNYSTNDGITIEDFSNPASFTVTGGTLEAVDFTSNQGFNYKSKGTGQPASDLVLLKALSQPFVLSSLRRVGMMVNLIDGSYTANIKIEFSSNGFAGGKSATKTFTGTDYVGNSSSNGDFGDNFLPVEVSDWTFVGGESINNVMTHMRIRFHSGTGLNGIVYAGPLVMNYTARTNIIFVWDDNIDTQLSISYPMMEVYGFKGTIACAHTFVNGVGYMTLAQLQDIQNTKGWDICNHTYDHINMGTLSESDQEFQLATQRDYMIANGLISAVDYAVLPQGGHNTDTPIALTRQRVVACRNGRVGIQSTIKGIDQKYLLKQIEFSSTATAASIISSINDALRYNGTILLTGHRLVVTPGSSIEFPIADFQKVLDYIASLGNSVKVMKLREWFEGMTLPRRPTLTPRSFVNRNLVIRNQV